MNNMLILYISLLAFLVMCNICVYIVAAVDKTEDYTQFKRFITSVFIVYVITLFFGQTKVMAAAVFTLQLIPVYFLGNYFMDGKLTKYRNKFISLHLICIAISGVIFSQTDNFTAYTLLFSISGYMPGAIALYFHLKRLNKAANYFYSLILFSGIVNTLTYPFFRFDEGAELWGWTGAVFTYVSIMLGFLLKLLDKKVSLDHKLQSELKLTNSLYKALIHDTSNDLNFVSLSLSRAIKKDDISYVKKANDRLDELIRFKTEISNQYNDNEKNLYPINIFEVMTTIDENYKDRFNQKRVKLIKNFNGENEDCYTEVSSEIIVKTIVGNLLTNALKFSSYRDIVKLNIHTDNTTLCFCVEDNGEGISDEIINSVKAFSKVTSRVGTENETGSGMGLGILCYIVDRVGGTIDFDNTHGTKVEVKIPIFLESVEEEEDDQEYLSNEDDDSVIQ